MARRGLLWAAAAAGLAACQAIPLQANPLEPEALGRAPITHFEVDRWLTLTERRLLEFAPREAASPTYDPDSNLLIVATRDGKVRAVDLLSDKAPRTLWSLNAVNPPNAGATVSGAVSYIPGGNGVLYAVETRTGNVLWEYRANDELMTSPVVADGKVLVGVAGDGVVAVEQDGGTWAWGYRRDPATGFTVRGASAPKVDFGTAYLGFSDGYAVALNVQDGSPKWERALSKAGTSFSDVDTSPALDQSGRLFMASFREGVYALNAETGDVDWRVPVAGVTSLLPRGDVVFVAGNERVGALHGHTGATLWDLPLPKSAGRGLVFVRGLLVVPTDEALLFVDPATGRSVQRWDPGEGVSASPVYSEGRLYVLSNLGNLYALRLFGRGG